MLPVDGEKEIADGEGPDDEIEQDAGNEPEGEQDGVEDEGTDAADGDEEQGEDAGSVDGAEGAQPKRRAKNDFGRLRQEARAAREEAAASRREIAELRAAQQARDAQTKEPSADEMALWSVEQRMEYRQGKAERATQQMLQQMQFTAADASDRSAYLALQADNPLAKKYAPEVESLLAEARKTGGNPTREVVLAVVVGRKALAAGKKAVSTAKVDGAKRIERQTTRPASNRSDAVGGDRNRSGTLAKRLAGVQI